jgi:hypothetical protein
MAAKRLNRNQLVRLRPPAAILATLDESGCCDGLPFMPEMFQYFGGTHRVGARAERACDTRCGPGTQRIPEAVTLDDLRCSGTGHAGCQARCRLYWKEAWLESADDRREPEPAELDVAYPALKQLAQHAAVRSGEGSERVFRCQMTELLRASKRVTPREAPAAFARELTSKNVGVGRWLSVLLRTIIEGTLSMLRLRHGLFMPFRPGAEAKVPTGVTIEVGDLVRVRSRQEIAETLDAKGKLKGLWFDREMVPFCGREFRVERKVMRFIDEASGRMVELASDCYMLENVVCSGDLSHGRRFCSRAIYPWWRTAWLEPVETNGRAGTNRDRAA